MPVSSMKKNYGKIKQYGGKNNLRKINENKIPKLIELTPSERVVKELFDKNILQLSHSQNITKNQQRNGKQNKVNTKEIPNGHTVLIDDSLDVKINSTFDDLFQTSNYNQVQYVEQISQLFLEDSFNSSSSFLFKQNSDKNKKGTENKINKLNDRNKKAVNTAIKKGKVQKSKVKKNKKKLVTSILSSINNGSLNVSHKNNSISHRKTNQNKNNLLNQPVDTSLVIENVRTHNKSLEISKLLHENTISNSPNLSNCNLVFNASTSRKTNSLKPNDISLFNNSIKQIHPSITPNDLISSTPKLTEKIFKKLYNSKIENVSPITARHSRLLRNSFDPSLSLFSSLTNNDVKSLNNSIRITNNNSSFKGFNQESTNSSFKGFKRLNNQSINCDVKHVNKSMLENNSNNLKIPKVVIENNSITKKQIISVPIRTLRNRINASRNKKIGSAINESTTNQSFKNFKCKKKGHNFNLRKKTENNIKLDDKSKKRSDDKIISIRSKITRSHTIHRKTKNSSKIFDILPDIKKKRKQIVISTPTRKKSVECNLQEWEKFSTRHSDILIADEPVFDDDDVQIISVEKLPGPLPKIDNDVEIVSVTNLNDNKISIVNDCKDSIVLKPGKKWRRSLAIIKQSNNDTLNISPNLQKGRKWRTSVFGLLFQQDKSLLEPKRSIFINNGAIHQRRQSIRPSIRIVKLPSLNKTKRSTLLPKKSAGYVPTITDDTVLESFSKLSLVVPEEREKTAKEIILKRCNQTEPLIFDECYSQRTLLKCRKIGEGVYGEVFMYKSSEGKCVVMKIIPIEGEQLVNGEHQKKYEEIISEIIITSELSDLRQHSQFKTNGFVEVLNVCLVQGKYPQPLIDLWDLYDEDRGSENDSPILFTDDQLYIILELANAGQDLEAYNFLNAEQAFSIFVQIACSLAVAETSLQFEHRDLHWGNVLVLPTDEPTTTYLMNGREFEVPTKGVKMTIIDFTLSRMTSDDCCIFNDLAMDPDLFTARGDYQFEIYRLMQKRNQDDWQKFEPYSNVLWLDYILDKMIGHLRYVRTNSKTHKNHIRKLSQIKKKILSYNSVKEFINSDVFSSVFL